MENEETYWSNDVKEIYYGSKIISFFFAYDVIVGMNLIRLRIVTSY
jgi:hypothetical protein